MEVDTAYVRNQRDERTYNKHYPLQSSDHSEQCDKCGSVLNNYTRALFDRNNNKTKNDIRQIMSIPSPPISPELQMNPLPGLSYEQRYANAWESDEEVVESDSDSERDEDEDGAMDDAIEDASEEASDSTRLFGGNHQFSQINNNKRDHLDYRGSSEIKAQDEFGSSKGKTSSLSSTWEDDSLIAPVLGHGITITLPPARMNKFQNIANTPHEHDRGAPVHDQMEREDKQQVTSSQSTSAFDNREMPTTVVGWDDDEEEGEEASGSQQIKLASQWDPEIALKKVPSPSYPVSSKSGSPTNVSSLFPGDM